MPPTDVPSTVPGLAGHWHRVLELPNGYQNWSWYKEGGNLNRVMLNDVAGLRDALRVAPESDLLLYTHHQIVYQDGVLKHTRSSPNWEGGLVTYATCKHLMRTTKRKSWKGVWLAGLCPKECESNTLLFVGMVRQEFSSNYELSSYLYTLHNEAREAKVALTNPRGDCYTPLRRLHGEELFDHRNYEPPQGHTRSIEYYKKSPGSISDRPDGKIPKWWRDVEYLAHGRRPSVFILSPVWLFSRPLLWSRYQPRRAVLRITPAALAASLQGTQPR